MRKKFTTEILETLSYTENVYAKEWLDDTKCEDCIYSFPVLDYKTSFTPDVFNKIVLQPIKRKKKTKL